MYHSKIETDRDSAAGACWVILTTGAPSTLRLARSLADAGFKVWTPFKLVAPRKSGARETHSTRPAPLIPGIVFARAYQVTDLLAAARAPITPHPTFSVFQPEGASPIIADRSLDPIRTAEREALHGEAHCVLSKRRGEVRAPGDQVFVPSDAFTGQSLVVERSNDRVSSLRFGMMRMTIETFHLVNDDV